MTQFKDRFNLIFDESDLSQEDFGKLFGASKSQVFNWRSGRGEPDTETLKLIAKIRNVSVEWLVGNSDIRTPITTIAAHRTDDPRADLPEEAQRSVDEFIELMKIKHGINKK